MGTRVFLGLSLIFVLSACVEIKDPEKEKARSATPEFKAEKKAEVYVATQLIVDQPLYLYEGRVLTKSQLESERSWPSQDQPQIYRYDYMEIRKGAVLYTLGQDVKLEIKELVSDGRIETIPEGSVAADFIEGRSGGSLNIIINKASGGGFKVLMRGQQGGKGTPGAEPDENLRGEEGEYLSLQDCNNPRAVDQWQGKKGKDGYNGKAGMRGGDTGTLSLTILDHDPGFFPDYVPLPGKGGPGGDGNPKGGAPGRRKKTMCPFLQMPQVFEDPKMFGGPGQRGPLGPDGSLGRVRILMKNQNFFHP